MALVPYKRPDDWWLDWDRTWDRDWSLVPQPVREFWPTPSSWEAYRQLCRENGYVRPWLDRRWHWTDLDGMERSARIDKDGFEVRLDVHQFKSYEITVRVENNTIIVEGKHDRRPNVQGYIERRFTRRYDLSSEFKIRDVSSNLSSDGILTVKALPAYPAIGATVKYFPVHQTHRPSYLD